MRSQFLSTLKSGVFKKNLIQKIFNEIEYCTECGKPLKNVNPFFGVNKCCCAFVNWNIKIIFYLCIKIMCPLKRF